MLRSKNNSCWGVDWEAIVGMICTQCKRQLRVCPRVISTHLEPGTMIGTAAMACRTVSAVGPSNPCRCSVVTVVLSAASRRNRRRPAPQSVPTVPTVPESGRRYADDARHELSENWEFPLRFINASGVDPKARVPPVFLPQIGRLTPDAVGEAIGIAADDIPMAARWIGSRPCSLIGQPNTMGDEMGYLGPGLAGQRCVDRLVMGASRSTCSRLPVIASVDERLSVLKPVRPRLHSISFIFKGRPGEVYLTVTGYNFRGVP